MNEHGIEIETPINHTDLRECPFCGTEVLVVKGEEVRFMCRDEECLLPEFSALGEYYDGLISWWNIRAEDREKIYDI